MKCHILLLSAVILSLLLTGCSFFVEIGNDLYKDVAFCFKKEKIKDDSLFIFVDKLVENSKTYDTFIKKSNLYDSVFGYALFAWGYSDFLSLCHKNGYEIVCSYSFKIEDQKFDYYYGGISYPKVNSDEGKIVKKIANILIYPKNTKKNDEGNFMLHFYQRRNGTWYFGGLGFEYVRM